MAHLRQHDAIAAGRYMSIASRGRENMPCSVYARWQSFINAAGIFAGLPFTDARACDDDRYPCPPETGGVGARNFRCTNVARAFGSAAKEVGSATKESEAASRPK